MTSHPSRNHGNPPAADLLDAEGPAAPPRTNGELVFTAPWQSRLFATTMRLYETGRIDWEEFRQGLIEQIAAHERDLGVSAADPSADGYDYWGCWQRSLESLLTDRGLVDRGELDESATVIASLPPGHDHDHPHDHGAERGRHDHAHD